MAESEDELRERIARLERRVERLRTEVSELRAASSDEPVESDGEGDGSAETSERERDHRGWELGFPDLQIESEAWLSRAGIGLFLLGLAFLLKFTIDQGWITPAVRVSLGAILGGGLLGVGLRTDPTRRRLRRILIGGSSAAFYGTVFAGFQLYGLFPHAVSFLAMVVVTAATVGLALREDAVSLALLGVAGGLATPFLLYSEAGGISGLVLYTCLIAAGGALLYLYRGWRLLMALLIPGTWLVLLVSGFAGSVGDGSLFERTSFQVGLIAAWVILGGIPVLRAVLERRRPDRWPAPKWPDLGIEPRAYAGPVYAAVILCPLLALAGTSAIWDLSDGSAAGIRMLGAGLYALGYRYLDRRGLPRYRSAHGVVTLILLTLGLRSLFDGSTLLLSWSLEAVLVFGIGRRLGDEALRRFGHVLFVALVPWLLQRILSTREAGEAVASLDALATLAVVVLGATSILGHSARSTRLFYAVGALAGWLGWWWSRLVTLPDGQAYVSVAWGLSAVALIAIGTAETRRWIQRAGLTVLALFVAKLFLVDLAALSALGRIALFLGFGALFLLISYALPGMSLLRQGEASQRE